MGWEGVPWMVGQGAMHSAEVGRCFAYAATSGNEGVLGPDDCLVQQLSVAGAGVRSAVGAAVVPCRAAGMYAQSYIARMTTEDTVSVAATGGAVRYDLVVGRVEDPWLSGEPWADPPAGQESVGPYMFTRIISGVSAAAAQSWEGARAYLASINSSSIPLAGLTIPASTATITNAMITNLRRVANPRRERKVYTINPGSTVNLTSATLADWFGSWQVSVPTWASRAVITLTIGGMRHARLNTTTNGTASGQVRAILGTIGGQAANYDFETTNTNSIARYGAAAGDTLTIPSATRGTVQTLKIQGSKLGGNVAASVDGGSFAMVDIEFQEVAG